MPFSIQTRYSNRKTPPKQNRQTQPELSPLFSTHRRCSDELRPLVVLSLYQSLTFLSLSGRNHHFHPLISSLGEEVFFPSFAAAMYLKTNDFPSEKKVASLLHQSSSSVVSLHHFIQDCCYTNVSNCLSHNRFC